MKIYYDIVVCGYIPCFDCPGMKVKRYDLHEHKWLKYKAQRYIPLMHPVNSTDECLTFIDKARRRSRARNGSIVCTIVFVEDDKYLYSMGEMFAAYKTGKPLKSKYPDDYNPLTHGHIRQIGIGLFSEDLMPSETGHGMYGSDPPDNFPRFWR